MKDFFAENLIEWKTIENYYAQGTVAGYCMALAECDKLLSFLLEQEGYTGLNSAEKIKKARDRFANPVELFKAVEVKANVFDKYDQTLSVQDLKSAISVYRESINDFVQGQIKEPGSWDRFISYLQIHFLARPGYLLNLLVGFLTLVILTIVLDNTHFGQNFIHSLAELFRVILPVLVLGVIVLGTLLCVMIVYLFYSNRRKTIQKRILRIRDQIINRASRNETRSTERK